MQLKRSRISVNKNKNLQQENKRIRVLLKHGFHSHFCKLQKYPSTGVLIKRFSENIQRIYHRKPMPKCDCNSNHALAWLFSCKFALYLYFQNTFSQNHLWMAASEAYQTPMKDLLNCTVYLTTDQILEPFVELKSHLSMQNNIYSKYVNSTA